MESTIVTTTDLKNFTSIGDNVDPELLFPFLLIAQQLYVQSVLGDALYNDIISRYDNEWLTGDTQTLYENYIVPAVAYSAWYCSAPFINYKTQRSGISTTTSDVMTPVSPEEFNIYSQRVRNFMDYYLKRLEDYLIANKTTFPLYCEQDTPSQGGGQIFLGYNHKRPANPYWDAENIPSNLLNSGDCSDC